MQGGGKEMTLIELLKITGVNISQGIRSVTFSAEGCEKSSVLNLSLDVGDFSFLPERNLISGAETKKTIHCPRCY